MSSTQQVGEGSLGSTRVVVRGSAVTGWLRGMPGPSWRCQGRTVTRRHELVPRQPRLPATAQGPARDPGEDRSGRQPREARLPVTDVPSVTTRLPSKSATQPNAASTRSRNGADLPLATTRPRSAAWLDSADAGPSSGSAASTPTEDLNSATPLGQRFIERVDRGGGTRHDVLALEICQQPVAERHVVEHEFSAVHFLYGYGPRC